MQFKDFIFITIIAGYIFAQWMYTAEIHVLITEMRAKQIEDSKVVEQFKKLTEESIK